MLPLLPLFFEQQPHVQVELSLNDQSVDLVNERFDIGIRGGSEPPEGMVARKICSVPQVLVASPRYLKAHGTPRHYTELTEHQLLRIRFLSGRLAPWLFKDKGRIVAFDGKARLLISDPEVILDAALLHMGIARMAHHHAQAALLRGELVALLPDQTAPSDVNMTLFYPHRAGLAPRVRVLVDFLIAQLAKPERWPQPRR